MSQAVGSCPVLVTISRNRCEHSDWSFLEIPHLNRPCFSYRWLPCHQLMIGQLRSSYAKVRVPPDLLTVLPSSSQTPMSHLHSQRKSRTSWTSTNFVLATSSAMMSTEMATLSWWSDLLLALRSPYPTLMMLGLPTLQFPLQFWSWRQISVRNITLHGSIFIFHTKMTSFRSSWVWKHLPNGIIMSRIREDEMRISRPDGISHEFKTEGLTLTTVTDFFESRGEP